MSEKVNNRKPPIEPIKEKETEPLDDPNKFKKIDGNIDRQRKKKQQADPPTSTQEKKALPLKKEKAFSKTPSRKQQVNSSPVSNTAHSPIPNHTNSQEQLIFAKNKKKDTIRGEGYPQEKHPAKHKEQIAQSKTPSAPLDGAKRQFTQEKHPAKHKEQIAQSKTPSAP
ncbi:MAG: hypothetical protein VXZ72_01640, partial [Chlamydiota bacterium]|nr:hypothetical protein [Chlamydiota bacterium]